MIGILTQLVNRNWVGFSAARAGWQSMTSSPLVCAPHESVCVCSRGWCHGRLITSEAKLWLLSDLGLQPLRPAQRCRFNPKPNLANHAVMSVWSVEAEHQSAALKSVCISLTAQVVDLCDPPTHLWGTGLFDRVKGSPSIRQCVLILALGRFPIDYLMTQKQSTSPDGPTHIQPNQSGPSANMAVWAWQRPTTWRHAHISTLKKSHKCLYYWVQDKLWMSPAASEPHSLCCSHYHCMVSRLAGAQYSHLHSWRAMPTC